jgi:hypothetical protein
MFQKPESFSFQLCQEDSSRQEVDHQGFRLVPFALLPALPSSLQEALEHPEGFPLPSHPWSSSFGRP